MSTWAVIPAKSPELAKTRLATVASPEERADLARRLLSGVVTAALDCRGIAGVVVVSASPEQRELATHLGAQAISDPAESYDDGLNTAITSGCQYVAALGATAALVLPADLPLVAPEVIAEFLDEAGDAQIALAPDRDGTGTNALLLRPPLVLPPLFGSDSFVRHVDSARARGLTTARLRLPELAFDVDTPADLNSLGPVGGGMEVRVG